MRRIRWPKSWRVSRPMSRPWVTGSPTLKERLKLGYPATWRHADIEPNDAVLDDFANRAFLMLKTGADVMWERAPVHLETTFQRFPHHQFYADIGGVLSNGTVVDIISGLPQSLISDIQLEVYRARPMQHDEGWGWDSKDIKQETESFGMSMGWNTDKFKNVPMILHAYRNAPKHIDWFIFADDDTYIHSQSLASFLAPLNPRHRHYIGSKALIMGGFAESDRVGARLKSKLKNPDDKVGMWFAHGGFGVVVSRGAVDALFWDPQREQDTVDTYSEWPIHACCGDAVFGYMLREELELDVDAMIDPLEMDIDPFYGKNLGTTRVTAVGGGWCRRIISWHPLKPSEIQLLYDWGGSLVARKSNIALGVLFSDLYHDFILPYISPVMEFWDIRTGSRVFMGTTSFTDGNKYVKGDEFEDEDDLEWFPSESVENCQRACEEISRYLGWKFELTDTDNTCTLEDYYVSRGVYVSPLDSNNVDRMVTSGWMTDRIRAIRSGEICDPLEYDCETETYNDPEDLREGWYFRELEKEQQLSQEL